MNYVAVTSGKGGTGKSCVAAYTGVALSESGKKTLLVEQGLTARSLDIITAAHGDAVFDIADVLEGRCEDAKAVVRAAYTDNLYLLPASGALYRPADPEAFTALLRRQRREHDYILVDGVDFTVAEPAAFDSILLVTTPDALSIRACQNHARELFERGAGNIRLVINNVPAQIQPIHGVKDFDDIIDSIGVQLIAVIPQSPKLAYSSNSSKMLDEESIIPQVFSNLAARLRGQPCPLLIR